MGSLKIYRTIVGFPDSGALFTCDTIAHKNELWLVPEWSEAPSLGLRNPVRIIPLSRLKHQKMPPNFGADFLLNDPMPRDVFEGRAQKEKATRFGVIENPEIEDHFPPHDLQ